MGGWATSLNQDTILNPRLVNRVACLLPEIFNEFNKSLSVPVEFIGLVGSAAYYEIDPPETMYGDIDVLVSLPVITGLTHNANVKYYNDLFIEFANSEFIPFVKPCLLPGNQFMIIEDGEDTVQVDLIYTFDYAKDWAIARYTSEHNVKGALFGNLLSAFSSLLLLSIHGYGVEQKLKDGIPVPFSSRNIVPKTISVNPKTFMIDIIHELFGSEIHPLLQQYSGFSTEDAKIYALAQSIKGMAKSLTLNDSYSKGLLQDIKNEDEFLSNVVTIYLKKMESATNSTKFDKAASEFAKIKAQKVKDQFEKSAKEIAKLLTNN